MVHSESEPKVFIPDSGEEPERVDSTITVTPELLADERAFDAMIGLNLRERLSAGKVAVVRTEPEKSAGGT